MGATSGTCGRKVVWALDGNGVLTISGTGPMANYTQDGGKPWEARKSRITSIVVENGVTTIGEYAFRNCVNLESISLPEGLKTIGQYAFNDCDKLESLAIPAGVTIGKDAFSYCDLLASVNLGSEDRIGYEAFRDDPSLATIIFTEGIQIIGDYSFYNCDSLERISLPESMESVGEYAFSICNLLQEVEIANGLETIKRKAFAGCNNLATINIPDSVTGIGESAFGEQYESHPRYSYMHCTNLKTITLSSSLEMIPESCYYRSGLEEITIPEGISFIGSNAFYNNASLTAIHLPLTMEEIASSAFNECNNLTDVYFAGTQAQAENILIGTYNTALTSATWHFEPAPEEPEEPEEPGTELKLPRMLMTIEAEAFAGVKAETITIPDSVDVIESRAFANCPNLKVVYFEGSPFSIANDILDGCEDFVVSVLKGSSAEKWANRKGLPVIYH